ncbi:ribonuclease H-like domain-containing protein, partial [Tanacetum coccineum]
ESSGPPVPKTAKQLAARRNQERVKSILLLAIPDEYILKFHNVPDAKSLWAAIKARFTGNQESKKMQKNKLTSQLEIHGNQKFLRSLPPAWHQIALIMMNKPDIDEIDIDDLYNNLRVYEDEMKKSSTSSSNTQNLAFISSEKSISTNPVNTISGDYGIYTAAGIGTPSQASTTPCAHDIDGDDLEELDLRWQVVMLAVRVKKFIQRTRRNMDFKDKRPVTLDMSKIECYNCHQKGHFARDCRTGRNQGRRPNGDNGRTTQPSNDSSSQALVAQDGLGGYDWSNDFEIEPINYALMAITSSSSTSSSDHEVQICSKCFASFDTLKQNLDKETQKHNRARLEIQGYELALESLEEGSSKNLTEILNSQMSAHDKTGLGFGTQLNEVNSQSETDSENSFTVFED